VGDGGRIGRLLRRKSAARQAHERTLSLILFYNISLLNNFSIRLIQC
jgi:hypothetical protein